MGKRPPFFSTTRNGEELLVVIRHALGVVTIGGSLFQ